MTGEMNMRQFSFFMHMVWIAAVILILAGTARIYAENVQERVAGAVAFDETWTYAGNSVIHSGCAELYLADVSSGAASGERHTVCINAGHGTSGGEGAQTLSHPDGTPKVTGGTTAAGEVYSTAISTGTTFLDGVTEAAVNLQTAMALKDLLLSDGYDVLMIRESDDVQLDNVARTVLANNCADIHIALHFDSTDSNKGCFYCSVPDVPSYRSMEPVASHWQQHEALGRSLVQGLQTAGIAVFESGSLQMDLTHTSYSTIPSVDIELGDRAADHSQEACMRYALGLKAGIDTYFSGAGSAG